ncbi:MAG: hypothetical protein C0469_01225 [Cyanobacteria bacterium DS2.3.42]|nr:hypothetical protein [Cyanobacteria bacterium DS2.3.42]
MDVGDTLEIEVVEQSQISEARRRIVRMSSEYGLNQLQQDKIALVITELGTNLVKHSTSGGRFLVQGLTNKDSSGLEIFSIDKGPGMDTVGCLVDGFSTTKTFGNGLGAAKRLSDDFDIFSQIGSGSIIKVRFWAKDSKPSQFTAGGLSVPKQGELISGDKWYVHSFEKGFSCLLVDGLGHGFEACEAATLALKTFKENVQMSATDCLKIIHSALKGSRGAVGAIAKVNYQKAELTYCGLGNITGLLTTDYHRKHLTSLNGTLGYEARKFLEVTLPWTSESILLMHSDGIAASAYQSLDKVAEGSAPLIAAWIYLNHGKKIDDATVLVVKGANRK